MCNKIHKLANKITCYFIIRDTINQPTFIQPLARNGTNVANPTDNNRIKIKPKVFHFQLSRLEQDKQQITLFNAH